MLTKRQKFARALIETGSVQEAGRRVGISSSTAYRWSKDDEVVDDTRQLKRAKMRALSAGMTKDAGLAVNTIKAIMQDQDVNPQTRLQAAMFVVKIGYERTDFDDIEKRVQQLEDRLHDHWN